MSTSAIGIFFLFLFATSQGVRDAFFGNVFQTHSFLVVALLVFGLSCSIFALIARVRRPGDLSRVFRSPRQLLLMNVTTAGAWLCYLFGLRHLEPAVVATFHNGVGPMVILAITWAGWGGRRPVISLPEGLCYVGSTLALLGLAATVLLGRSGMQVMDAGMQPVALAFVAAGGASVTVSYLCTKKFTDAGIGSESVMSTRFMLALLAAAALHLIFGDAVGAVEIETLPWLAVAAFGLMVMPSFFVQLGVSRTSPLVAHVFRSLGPVFVFIVQQIDGRLTFSGETLICVVVFSCCTIAASVLRGWQEMRDERV